MAEAGGWRLGVDVGGTFTDLVLLSPEGRATHPEGTVEHCQLCGCDTARRA